LEGVGEASPATNFELFKKSDWQKILFNQTVNDVVGFGVLVLKEKGKGSTPKKSTASKKVLVDFENSTIEVNVQPSSTIKELVLQVVEGLGEDPATVTSFALMRQNRNRLLFNQIVGEVITSTESLLLERRH